MTSRYNKRSLRRQDWASLSIGITGTPGTGKKSVTRELAALTGLAPLSINELAISKHWGTWEKGGKETAREFLVNLKRLQGKIPTKRKIVYGHLLPEVVPANALDLIVVLRCSPTVLRRRYHKRKYAAEKIQENVEAELLDLVLGKSISRYGKNKVLEFDTTRTKNPRTVALKILQFLEGRKVKSGTAWHANWAGTILRSPARLQEVRALSLPLSHKKGESKRERGK